jgi:hypothetical protein
MKRGLRFAGVLAPLLAAYACSTYEGVSSDAPDASADAASDAPNAPPPVSNAVDAGADGPWCALHEPDAAVCDDFDEPGTFGGRWKDGTDKYHATMDVVDDAKAFSKPRVLRVVQEPNAPDVSTALLKWSVATPTTSISYGFAVRFDHVATALDGGAADLSLFQVHVSAAASDAYVTFGIAPGVTNAGHFSKDKDGGATRYGRQIPLPTVDDGKWHEVVIAVNLASRTISVTLDGNLHEDVFGEGFEVAPFDFYGGLTFAVPTADGWTIAIDDAWLDYH